LYQRQFYIPYNFFTDEASLRVNAHLTHYAVKKRECLEKFKEGAKQRRKLKRQCEAEISRARTRGDASSLWTALDVQEYTHVEKARKLDACSDLKKVMYKLLQENYSPVSDIAKAIVSIWKRGLKAGAPARVESE
jgi:hypothetical protein